MPLRTRLFIILSVVIIIILAVSVLLLVSKKKKAKQAATKTTTVETGGVNQINRLPVQGVADISSNVTNGTITIAQPTTEEMQKNAAKQMSKVFTERYGSFSNQNGYQNIIEVKELSTVVLYSDISKIMTTTQNQSTYYGMTTKVVTMSITKWSSSSATITLSTSRSETKSSSTKKINQDAIVQMTKSGNSWLVSSFKWQ